jgi:hypothetical protein
MGCLANEKNASKIGEQQFLTLGASCNLEFPAIFVGFLKIFVHPEGEFLCESDAHPWRYFQSDQKIQLGFRNSHPVAPLNLN